MNIDEFVDFANEATEEVGKYIVSFALSPKKLMSDQYQLQSLDWESVCYGDDELEKVPDDKRGIYAFAICHESDVLPPHGYILYIGIAGRDSNRSLKERYKDYLNSRQVIRNRPGIASMIGRWYEVLKFFYAPISDDVSSEDLKQLEQQLNTAFMPPFSRGDLDAETRRKRKAFP